MVGKQLIFLYFMCERLLLQQEHLILNQWCYRQHKWNKWTQIRLQVTHGTWITLCMRIGEHVHRSQPLLNTHNVLTANIKPKPAERRIEEVIKLIACRWVSYSLSHSHWFHVILLMGIMFQPSINTTLPQHQCFLLCHWWHWWHWQITMPFQYTHHMHCCSFYMQAPQNFFSPVVG